ncbi:MAG: hypothetical protein P8Y25_13645, partial [Chromatiaceae bacterium]
MKNTRVLLPKRSQLLASVRNLTATHRRSRSWFAAARRHQRRQADTEALGDFPMAVSARGISPHNGQVSLTAIPGNLRQRWRWRSALHLRNAQAVTR